jgi:alpha-galactosidase
VTAAGSDVTIPEGAGRFYRHGWQSWSPAGWVGRDRLPPPITVPEYRVTADDPEHLDDDRPGGAWVGAVELGDGEVLLAGSPAAGARVECRAGSLRTTGPGEWVVEQGPEEEVFAGYAAALAAATGVRTRDPGPVWCSWYSFYRDIDQERILGVLDGLADLPFGVVQVDDGWQRAIGDWEPGDRFPAGMAALAERIVAGGRTAGLWLAPFLVHESAPLAVDHPEALLHDPSGAPVVAAYNWGGAAYALDVTHPAGLEAAVAAIAAARAWGYGFLKLDFLYAAALPGERHRPVARETAYRLALEALRDAAGDDCFLLACGAPIVPTVGVCDALRVGPDVAPYWENADRVRHLNDRSGPGAADAIATTLNRLWLREVITIDPDVAFFRTRYNLLTPRQRSLLVDLAHICGFRATSDPPAWLDPAERATLERFLTERPAVERLDRYRFAVGSREVDFTPVVEGRPG